MTARKQQAPRLELARTSDVCAEIIEGAKQPIAIWERGRSHAQAHSLRDAKRLHAFLAKAIAYLESQRKARKAGR